jgi:hypothetical protein
MGALRLSGIAAIGVLLFGQAHAESLSGLAGKVCTGDVLNPQKQGANVSLQINGGTVRFTFNHWADGSGKADPPVTYPLANNTFTTSNSGTY